MDNKRTPNHSKPVAHSSKSNSQSKFAKPRSHRKQDSNTTLSSHKSHNASLMAPPRSLHTSVRQNLDITLSGLGVMPNIKSSILPTGKENELTYFLAYNDYLQALMKQQLIKKTIKEQEMKLNDQILIQTEHLHKLEISLKEIVDQIENLCEQSDIVELSENLKNAVNKIEALCFKYNTYSRLHDLEKILTKESDLLTVRNIKSMNSQEEYDKLISTLNKLKCAMQKIIKAEKNFKEVSEFADTIKKFNELKSEVTDAANKLNFSNKKAVALVLKQSSDFFAQQGNYF